jgi:hypothetical protein
MILEINRKVVIQIKCALIDGTRIGRVDQKISGSMKLPLHDAHWECPGQGITRIPQVSRILKASRSTPIGLLVSLRS